MSILIRRLTFGLVFLNFATIAYAADGSGQDNNASPLVWIFLLLPTFLIIVMVFFMTRRSRALSLNSLKRFDEHRTFSEEHMRRLESQIENLDKRLIRMIELLEAVEQGQRREHN
jgi:hypothetical protein